MPVDVCPRDKGSQWAWLEMGQCYSKKSVVPESDSPERSSMTSGSLESDTQQENKVSKVSLDTGQMAFTLAQLESLETCLKEAEEKAKALSEQLSVSEGTKSKLLEQVSRLEEKLEAVDHKEASGEPYEKMVLVKNQCIQKLQAEVKASQEQLTAQHEKKVKKLQTDLATAKQEAAITVLELNEKIKTLCEGKPAPRGQYYHVTDPHWPISWVIKLRSDNVLAALTLSASSALTSTLAALEEPFSPPQHRGSPSLGWLRSEPPPSACGEVWKERHGREPRLRARSRASASSSGRGLGGRVLRGLRTGNGWRAGPAGRPGGPRAVSGLAPRPAAAEVARGHPAVPACRGRTQILAGP
ncbi:coiled-coil domain-containing protein 192 [Macaca mulatta]